MPEFNVYKLRDGLFSFNRRLKSVDAEKVKRETLKKSAAKLAEMVRQAIISEPEINSPASLNSPYSGGPGPNVTKRKHGKSTNLEINTL